MTNHRQQNDELELRFVTNLKNKQNHLEDERFEGMPPNIK